MGRSQGIEGIFVAMILFSLLRFTGHLSDRLKVFAGQNENLLLLSCSAALFVKTEVYLIVGGTLNRSSLTLFNLLWAWLFYSDFRKVQCLPEF